MLDKDMLDRFRGELRVVVTTGLECCENHEERLQLISAWEDVKGAFAQAIHLRRTEEVRKAKAQNVENSPPG